MISISRDSMTASQLSRMLALLPCCALGRSLRQQSDTSMRHTTFRTEWAIARSLEHVGERWSILISRDAAIGLSRFDQFQCSLGIASDMLTRRLNSLVASGLLRRKTYCSRPLRNEYLLTDRGRDFQRVLLALAEWGNKPFEPVEPVTAVAGKGRLAGEPFMTDERNGAPRCAPAFTLAVTPAAESRARPRPRQTMFARNPQRPRRRPEK